MLEIEYPITPLEGAPFIRVDSGENITLSEIAEILNTYNQQQALDALGISLINNGLSVSFVERGKAYSDPENDRTCTDEFESEISFQSDIELSDHYPTPLPLSVELDGWVQENVNFLGRIIVKDIYVIPLTGRGTAALEGKANDCHAGYCTGGACASFQERAALILAISLAAGATNQDLIDLAIELSGVDARYHGRRAILDYTLHCCLHPYSAAGSYRQFMLARKDEVSPVMAPLLSEEFNAIPGEAYFSKLRQKFSEEELLASRRNIVEETPPPAVEESLFPVTPLEPDLQCPLNVQNLVTLLSYGPRQGESLKALGFTVSSNSTVDLDFCETGRAYVDPDGDRQVVEESPSNMRFHLTLGRSRDIGALDINVRLGGWEQKGVNFLGKVDVELDHRRYVLPLTGRGTAALEGRRQDAHAGFCTGPACAGFQIRAALCLAVARAIGASDSDIEALGREFHAINARYHGRAGILDYTIHCALTPNAESYLDFMTERYGGDDVQFPLLQAMRSTGRPHRGYFEALHKKFSVAELDRERQKRVPVVTVLDVDPPLPQPKFELQKTPGKKNKGMETFTKAAIAVSFVAAAVVIIVFFSLRK